VRLFGWATVGLQA